ncbi:hypothetical protein GN956_G4217, partial [Arapaima gigas]
GFSPVCVRICFFSSDGCRKPLPHSTQMWGKFLLCTASRWRFSRPCSADSYSQNLHLYTLVSDAVPWLLVS